MDVIRDSRKNKTLAFSAEERAKLGLTGLLPPGRPWSMQQQIELVVEAVNRKTDDLCKYEYLMNLKERDERLFYAAMVAHTALLMPLVYTPTVGKACIEYSRILTHRAGLYISLEDRGNVAKVLESWPAQDIKAICVTDGERILGLGDLGANGMGIPVGKLALYTALAGVPPHQCLPVTLDVGTNNKKLLSDPFYIGLRRDRALPSSDELDGLVEEFVSAVQTKYGAGCMVQWEDFGNDNAFRLLHKYQPRACTFNDDIQGTAGVVLAALMGATRMTGQPLAKGTYLFMGAGEAGVGIADLIAYAISAEEGITVEAARSKIWLVDSKGLVVASRLNEGVNHGPDATPRAAGSSGLAHHKIPYAHEGPALVDLRACIAHLKPTALIGVSAQPGVFTQEVVTDMCALQEQPIIFALSNPTSKAECTAEQAYGWSKGKAIFASGSPFHPVVLPQAGSGADKALTLVPAQANNSYIFPAVGLAVIAAGITRITDHTFYVSAKALAATVEDADIAVGCVMPPLTKIRDVSAAVAAAVVDDAYAKGTASVQPKPADTLAFVKAAMWNPTY